MAELADALDLGSSGKPRGGSNPPSRITKLIMEKMEKIDLTITVKDVNKVEKQIQITIPADVISNALNKYYLNLRKSVKIKGFRPGKVPRSILERFYKKQVENEVVNNLINETYQQAIKEKSIRPVSQPIIDNYKLEIGTDFTYTARVEIQPEIDLKENYLGLEVEQETANVTDDDVNKYLDEMRNFHAQLKAVKEDRPIRSGDFVLIDFTGNIEGVPFKDGEVKDKLIEIKPDAFLPGFTNQLIGLRQGVNREIMVTIPEDYEQKEIAGRALTFQVSIKEIKEKIIPPLDDNFARDVGEFETLSELRENAKKEITAREKQRIANSLHNTLIQKILQNNPFEVPSSLIDKQTEYLILQARSQMKIQGVRIDSSTMIDRELKEAYRPVAEFQVKRAFLVEEIARREGIEVEESEIKQHMKILAANTGQNLNALTDNNIKEDAKKHVKSKILEGKVLAFLTEKANIKLVEKKNNA